MGFFNLILNLSNGKSLDLSKFVGSETKNIKNSAISIFDINNNGILEETELSILKDIASGDIDKDGKLDNSDISKLKQQINDKIKESTSNQISDEEIALFQYEFAKNIVLDNINDLYLDELLTQLEEYGQNIQTSTSNDGNRIIYSLNNDGTWNAAVLYPNGTLKAKYTVIEPDDTQIPDENSQEIVGSVVKFPETYVFPDEVITKYVEKMAKVEYSPFAQLNIALSSGSSLYDIVSNTVSEIDEYLKREDFFTAVGRKLLEFDPAKENKLSLQEVRETLEKLLSEDGKAYLLNREAKDLSEMPNSAWLEVFKHRFETITGKKFSFYANDQFQTARTKIQKFKGFEFQTNLFKMGCEEIKNLKGGWWDDHFNEEEFEEYKNEGILPENANRGDSKYVKTPYKVALHYLIKSLGSKELAEELLNNAEKENNIDFTRDTENNMESIKAGNITKYSNLLESLANFYNKKAQESLMGEKIEDLEARYKEGLKNIFGYDDKEAEVMALMQNAQSAGATLELALDMVLMALTGNAIGAINAGELVQKTNTIAKVLTKMYGPGTGPRAIKFLSTLTNVGIDSTVHALSLAFNDDSFNNNAANLWERTKNSADYMFYGAYIMGPALSKIFGEAEVAAKGFEGAVSKTTNGATVRTISANRFIGNLSAGNETDFMDKLAKVIADTAGYTLHDTVAHQESIQDAFKGQVEFQAGLGMFSHFMHMSMSRQITENVKIKQFKNAIESKMLTNIEIREETTSIHGNKKPIYRAIDTTNGKEVFVSENVNSVTSFLMARVSYQLAIEEAKKALEADEKTRFELTNAPKPTEEYNDETPIESAKPKMTPEVESKSVENENKQPDIKSVEGTESNQSKSKDITPFPNTPCMESKQFTRMSYNRLFEIAGNNTEIQQETKLCLNILDNKLNNEFRDKYHSATDISSSDEYYQDFVLADGTIVSKNKLYNAGNSVLLYVKDINGRELYLCATTKEQIEQANKIYNFVSKNCPKVQQDAIPFIHTQVKNGIELTKAIQIANEELGKIDLTRHKKLAPKPTLNLTIQENDPRIANIELTVSEKIKADIQGISYNTALNNKKLKALYELNGKNENNPSLVSDIQMNTIDYLSYLSDNIKSNKLYSELSQDAGEIPFDKPVVLSDGTVLVRKQVPKAENSKFEPEYIISVTEPNGKEFKLYAISENAKSSAKFLLKQMEAVAKSGVKTAEVENIVIIKDNCGSLSLTDSSGKTLGSVQYAIKDEGNKKVLTFEGLKADIQGQGIGSRLIEELIKVSKQMGAEGRLYAVASPTQAGNGKITNIEFYYKLGFKAVNPEIDAEIKSFTDKGEPVPARLNVFTEIELSPSSKIVIKQTAGEVRSSKIAETSLDKEVERGVRVHLLDEFEKLQSQKARDIDKKIFDLVKDINNNSEIEPSRIEEIRDEIKELAQTNPQEALNLELVLNTRTTVKKCSEITREEIGAVVQHLRRQFELEKNNITAELERLGATVFGTFTNRVKSDMSEFDKIANFALKNPDKPLELAIRDVRDNYGGRIELKSIDMKAILPEVQKLVNQGKYAEAGKLAMEKLSEQIVGFVQNIINDPKHVFEITRVSNYIDSSNIATLNEQAIAQLQIDAQKSGMPIVIEEWKTKQQGSAYPAFQFNVKTQTGKVIEIQIRLDKVGEYAEVEHYVYDLMTDKDIIGRKEKVAPLFKPLEEILKDNLTKDEYEKYYLPYTRAQYHYRLLKALGIDTPEPKLEDFPPPPGKTFDPRLKAENLFLLHDWEILVVKNRLITSAQALKEYNKAVESEQ